MIFIGERQVNKYCGWGANSSDTVLIIPANLVSGNYYLGAIADYNIIITEDDEGNNAITGNITRLPLSVWADLFEIGNIWTNKTGAEYG